MGSETSVEDEPIIGISPLSDSVRFVCVLNQFFGIWFALLNIIGIYRRRVRGGMQQSMKVVIRGERGVGKTSLFHRLRGLDFDPTYNPSCEISVETIAWEKEGEGLKVRW